MATSNPAIWLQVWPIATHDIASRSQEYEREGWTGIAFGDTECLSQDPFILMSLGMAATTRLNFMTGVTNGYTRHPSVLANCAATLQAQSGGRCVIGIGRGDSALAHLGLAPGTFASYRRFVTRLQGYLSGADVAFDPNDVRDGAASLSKIEIGNIPPASRLKFLDHAIPKVPVDVHTGGPKTLEMAARVADRITIILGADPARIRWAMDIIENSARAAGRDPSEIDIGVVLSVVPHPDRATARLLGAGHQASMMRVAAMLGHIQGPLSDDDRKVIENVIHAYDMDEHCTTNTPQSAVLTPDFVDRHFVVGPPDECVKQLRGILDLGIRRVHIATSSVIDASRGATPEEREEAALVHRLLVNDIVAPLQQA